jgi:hypothetical protein
VVGWRPVCVDKEILDAFVDGLQRSSGLDVDNPANGNIVTFWWLTEKHREPAGQNNERLLLLGMYVAFAARAGLVAPYVRAGVTKADPLLKLGYVSSRLVSLMRPREPLKLFG